MLEIFAANIYFSHRLVFFILQGIYIYDVTGLCIHLTLAASLIRQQKQLFLIYSHAPTASHT